LLFRDFRDCLRETY